MRIQPKTVKKKQKQIDMAMQQVLDTQEKLKFPPQIDPIPCRISWFSVDACGSRRRTVGSSFWRNM